MYIHSFGEKLIQTGDLDPVYYVRNANLPEPQLCRWLLAYWCFYHVGAASWLSEHEGRDYWNWMETAAANNDSTRGPNSLVCNLLDDRWPRAAERRHFRGDKCVKAIEWLAKDRGTPEEYVCHLATRGTETSIINYVQTWPQFGPWIAFKAADMMERVYGAPVQFSRDIGLMYEEPRAGLRLAIDHPLHEGQYNTLGDCYAQLLTYFHDRIAPPWPKSPDEGRPCGPQEVETVLCKWKSHANGKYAIGKDIHEVRAACAGWGETADRLLAVLPAEVT
jgi:hypothetical protein